MLAVQKLPLGWASNPIIRREDALPYIRPMGRTAYDVIKGSSLRWLMMQLQEKRSAFSLLIIGLLPKLSIHALSTSKTQFWCRTNIL